MRVHKAYPENPCSLELGSVKAYPTIDGVIDTIQWEGFREGINDVRYLTTLNNTITTAKAEGRDTSTIEAWVLSLKSMDLTTVDLNIIRSQMIEYILILQNPIITFREYNWYYI